MLKLLLGHWKAHRKKPSLLPEDGDVHFEDPSTINPLFEDSDSSVSSTRRNRAPEPQDQIETASQVENEQNENETDVPIVNELIDVSIPTHSKDSVIPDKSVPKDEITNTEKDKSSLIADSISESGKAETSKSVQLHTHDQSKVVLESSSHEDSTNNISSKDETEIGEKIKEEEMRLYNQPSTSAISGSKKYVDSVSNRKEKTALPISSANEENTDKMENKLKKSVNKINGFHNDKTQPSTKPLERLPKSSPLSKSGQSNEQPIKPAKLRARAIDELIKKFQGPTTENDDEINKISKPDKNISNNVTKTENIANNVTKTENISNNVSKTENTVNNVTKLENKSLSSPSTEIKSETQKITKPESKNSSKTITPKIESELSNKSGQEIEALSNIFKFPPPPPLEQLKNESSLHGKILKDRKFNQFLPPPNKVVKENSNDKRENDSGKTRSDSSLDRTRSASSNKPKDKEKIEIEDKKEIVNKTPEQSSKEPIQQTSADTKSLIKGVSTDIKNVKEAKRANETSVRPKSIKDIKSAVSKNESIKENKRETKTIELISQMSNSNILMKKESPVSNRKAESTSNFLHNNAVSSSSTQKNVPTSPVETQKSNTSNKTPKPYSTTENENVKSHSEDSGITRGDQISSETTQETPLDNPPEETNAVPNLSRKVKKEKKLKSISKKNCKNCRHAHDSISIRRGQCDDYYDGLTGIRHKHKSRHSDSWTSELSWEEKEFLRRLRSRRGTVRSNTPSTKSRLSKHRFLDENHFRRHHNFRRSASDESSFYGASLCSCDECWAMYIKDYAYGRASLRGMSPVQEMCTCRISRNNFLGRRVQFRSDTIHEVAPPERATTTTTPAPSENKKEDDETDDKSSQKSSKSKDGDSVNTHPEGIKDKKSKISEEAYRFVTPWELEEWDLLMRKHLLQRRRRRARCMGIMALAMVVFVGLVVAILMVYLRRKVI